MKNRPLYAFVHTAVLNLLKEIFNLYLTKGKKECKLITLANPINKRFREGA